LVNPWSVNLLQLNTGSAGSDVVAMSKDPQRSSERDRLERDEAALDALETARLMAPGLERNEALKQAGALRRSADERGVVFAKRGRPRKS
jgi:hypothetical protein